MLLLALPLSLSLSPPPLPSQQPSRRALLCGAAASLSLPLPSFASPKDDAIIFMKEADSSSQAGPLQPSVKVVSSGAKSTMLSITAPPSSSLSNDYVDTIWFADANTGDVLSASSFRPNGKSLSAAASAESTLIAPEHKARFDKGASVVPYLHAKAGGTWVGATVDIR